VAIRKVRGLRRSGAEETADKLLLDAKMLSDIREVVGNDALRDLGLCVIKFSESESEDLALPLNCNTCRTLRGSPEQLGAHGKER